MVLRNFVQPSVVSRMVFLASSITDEYDAEANPRLGADTEIIFFGSFVKLVLNIYIL